MLQVWVSTSEAGSDPRSGGAHRAGGSVRVRALVCCYLGREVNRVALGQWRVQYEAETPRRLNVIAPPTTSTVKISGPPGGRTYELETREEPAAAIGMSLSAPMVRLLGHHEGYGLAFPVRRALAEWNRYCRAHHQRWPDHIDQPACSVIAYAVIRDQCSLVWAAEQAGVSYLRAERLLTAAVERMASWQGRWFEVAS